MYVILEDYMKRINLRIEEVLYEQILAECNSRNKTFNEFMNDTLKELILSNTYNDLEERVDIKINRIVETLERLVDLNVSISNSTHIQNELINEVLNIERIEFDDNK
jgi:type III secretory pathway component EscV